MDPSDLDPGFEELDGVPLDDMTSFGDPTAGAFSGFFAFLVVLMVVIAIVGVLMSLRRAKKFRDAGVDPLDPETDLQVRMAHRLGAPATALRPSPRATAAPPPPVGRTLEDRLAKVDRLHAAGTISDSERDEARGRILGGL